MRSLNMVLTVFVFYLMGSLPVRAMEIVLDNSLQFTESPLKHFLVTRVIGAYKNNKVDRHVPQIDGGYNNNNDGRQIVLARAHPAGVDGRARIFATTKYPWCCFGALALQKDGQLSYGTGVLVGPHHILTAAHCIRINGGWIESATFFPGRNDVSDPFGSARVVKIFIDQRYLENEEPDFDIALLVLDRPLGVTLGWMGAMFAEDLSLFRNRITVTGYPGSIDKGGSTQLWSMTHRALNVQNERIFYEIDTEPGQSGSPVWTYFEYTDAETPPTQMPMALGVHIRGEVEHGTGNNASRITEEKFRWLMNAISRNYQLAVPIVVQPSTDPLLAETMPIQEGTRDRYEQLLIRGDDYFLGRNGITQDYKFGRECYVRVFQQQENLAAQVEAVWRLGNSYYYARPKLDCDIKKAASYYELVASQNNNVRLRALANLQLGKIYDFFLNKIPQGNVCFKRAAEQSDHLEVRKEAREILAFWPFDPQRKLKSYNLDDTYNYLLELSADDSPHTRYQANLNLSEIYFKGLGKIKRDPEQGRFYLDRARQASAQSSAAMGLRRLSEPN